MAKARATAQAAKAELNQAAQDESDGSNEYPMTLYRKTKVDSKHPNGYEARQCPTFEDRGRFGKEWKESPDEA